MSITRRAETESMDGIDMACSELDAEQCLEVYEQIIDNLKIRIPDLRKEIEDGER